MNLGCVIYSESIDGIDAKWIFNRDGNIRHGIGKGKRLSPLNKKRRFEGDFEITYSVENENISQKLILSIKFKSGYYNLIWKIGNKITDVGIGIESDNKLLVSYKQKK